MDRTSSKRSGPGGQRGVAVPSPGAKALRIGAGLSMGIFRIWRRNLSPLDALILLAITRSNVDGILYGPDLRRRFGGAAPIAPDSLRQPVSVEVIAMALRISEGLAHRRIRQLSADGECLMTPNGMLITADQVEATNRLAMIEEIYALLRNTHMELQHARLATVSAISAAPGDPRPVRSAAAHGAKYALRLLASLSYQLGDAVDGLILAHLLSEGRPGGQASLAKALGLSRSTTAQKVTRLTATGVCQRNGMLVEIAGAGAADWRRSVEERNTDHLFQLFAGLAEVGALSDFTAGAPPLQRRHGPA